MARIKFVLWERYRAWWGAHQLNEEDPLLLDRLKAEERNKSEAPAEMTKSKLRRLEQRRERQARQREAKREIQKVAADEARLKKRKKAEELAEFQRLATAGKPESNTST
jgi:hypothetical protein